MAHLQITCRYLGMKKSKFGGHASDMLIISSSYLLFTIFHSFTIQCRTCVKYEPSIWPCSPWVLHSSLDRAPAQCLGGHRFESCWGLRVFLCPWTCDMLIISSSQKWVYTKGWQNEEDSKTFVGDKRNRPIMCMFCGDLPLTLVFSCLLQRDLLKGKWSLVENISKHNYCLSHKVYHPLLPAVLIHKYFKDGRQVPGIEVQIPGSTRWNEKLINLPILHFLFLILLFIIFNSRILWLKNSCNNIIRLYNSWTKVAYLCWFLWEQVSQ